MAKDPDDVKWNRHDQCVVKHCHHGPDESLTPQVMKGKACIRGMRVTVGMIVGQIGAGCSIVNVLKDFPTLNAKIYWKRSSTLHGCRWSVRLRWQKDEYSDRHEFVAMLEICNVSSYKRRDEWCDCCVQRSLSEK